MSFSDAYKLTRTEDAQAVESETTAASHLQDMMDPDPKRLRKHLSVLLNFLAFEDSRAESRQAMEEEMQKVRHLPLPG